MRLLIQSTTGPFKAKQAKPIETYNMFNQVCSLSSLLSTLYS